MALEAPGPNFYPIGAVPIRVLFYGPCRGPRSLLVAAVSPNSPTFTHVVPVVDNYVLDIDHRGVNCYLYEDYQPDRPCVEVGFFCFKNTLEILKDIDVPWDCPVEWNLSFLWWLGLPVVPINCMSITWAALKAAGIEYDFHKYRHPNKLYKYLRSLSKERLNG